MNEWRRIKEPLDESERGEWKSWLKTQHSENSWHLVPLLDGKQMGKQWKQWDTLFFFGGGTPKSLQMMSAAMKLKDAAPWKKSYDQPINKGLSSQSYVFSSSHVWIWELDYKESWAPKNWYFWVVCWRRLMRVPWTARRSKQSILKEISPEYSLEGLMLKVKLQYLATWCKELTHWERSWCWERLKAGGEGDDRG